MIVNQTIVLKIGTASITNADGTLNQRVMVDIARQVEYLINNHQTQLILVSSGAVGTGKKYIKAYKGTLKQKKAAAAVGNPILLNKYKQLFSPYNIPIAQVLCERNHFSNSHSFKQLKLTINTLWKNGILPIANENDVIRNLEMSFSDNDELALLLGVGFNADIILLGTVVNGVYDDKGKTIKTIPTFTKKTLGYANDKVSGLGLGGMVSKLTYSRLATTLGIKTVIFGINEDNSIKNALNGKTGTICLPQDCSHDVRSKWLKKGCFLNGSIIIITEGLSALKNGKQLQNAHISKVVKPFYKGEIIEMLDEHNNLVGVARASVNHNNTKKQHYIAKRNEVILF